MVGAGDGRAENGLGIGQNVGRTIGAGAALECIEGVAMDGVGFGGEVGARKRSLWARGRRGGFLDGCFRLLPHIGNKLASST